MPKSKHFLSVFLDFLDFHPISVEHFTWAIYRGLQCRSISSTSFVQIVQIKKVIVWPLDAQLFLRAFVILLNYESGLRNKVEKSTLQNDTPLFRAELLDLGLILASRDVACGPLGEAVENVGDSLFEVQLFLLQTLKPSYTVNNGPVADRFCRTDGTRSGF